MWTRKTPKQLAEVPAQRQRAESHERANPGVALGLALIAVLFLPPGCSGTLDGRVFSWAESIGLFLLAFVLFYVVQVLFGPLAASLLAGGGASSDFARPSGMEICPECQGVQAWSAPGEEHRCAACGSPLLEPLEHWRWQEAETSGEHPDGTGGTRPAGA